MRTLRTSPPELFWFSLKLDDSRRLLPTGCRFVSLEVPLNTPRPRLISTSRKYPPGPPNGLLGISHMRRLNSDLLGFLRGLVEDYGDLVTFRIGPARLYVIAHPQQISELLVKQAASLHKFRIVKRYFKRWMGDGLLLNEGSSWQVQRRKMRWAIQQIDPQSRSEVIGRTAQEFLRPVVGQTVDVARLMDRLAFTLNVRTLFGESGEASLDPLYHASDELHRIGVQEMSHWNMLPDWTPTPAKAHLREQMRIYKQRIREQVTSRVSSLEKSTEQSALQPTGPGDLLSAMLRAKDRQGGSSGMTPTQARDEVANLLMGGKETVGATLTWAIWLLAQHADVQQRAAAEVRDVLADRPLEVGDVSRLPYTQWVIKEAMRLYPPVYSITRETIRPIVVGGYRIPKDCILQVPVYAVHRDARWYDRPDEFAPERFRPDIARRRPKYTHIPFGVGKRDCVGKFVGYEQCVLVLAEALRQAEFTLPADAQPPKLATDIVLHPRDPLPVIFHERG